MIIRLVIFDLFYIAEYDKQLSIKFRTEFCSNSLNNNVIKVSKIFYEHSRKVEKWNHFVYLLQIFNFPMIFRFMAICQSWNVCSSFYNGLFTVCLIVCLFKAKIIHLLYWYVTRLIWNVNINCFRTKQDITMFCILFAKTQKLSQSK